MYDLNVGIVVIKNSLILVGKRSVQGTWQMPQGGIEVGETPIQAAARELKEETGIEGVDWVGETDWMFYEFPNYVRKNPFFKNSLGKKQKWFYAIMLNSDIPIVLNDEFCDHAWKPDSWVQINIVKFKKEIYSNIFSNNVYNNIKNL